METKRCPRCAAHQPVSEFGPNRRNKDGLQTYCRPHTRDVQNEWSEANRPRKNEIRRNSRRRTTYGLEPGDVRALLAAQGNVCGICNRPISAKYHVDHREEPFLVRGITHPQCNVMIAMAGHDPSILRLGAEYLEKHA